MLAPHQGLLAACALLGGQALFAALLASLGLGTQAGPLPVDAPARAEQYEVSYHHTLKNKTDNAIEDVKVYLPIPVDDGYQKVLDLRIVTGGEAWDVTNRTDAYGTKIRRVMVPRIEAGAEVQVGFSCVIELAPPTKVALDRKRAGKAGEIPKDVRDRFMNEDPIFGLGTELVRETALRMLREHPDPVDRAIAIHDLVAGTFDSRAEDGSDPAPTVLARRSGSCTELAYVFCALCRASGIPTRLVGGSIFPLSSSNAQPNGASSSGASQSNSSPGNAGTGSASSTFEDLVWHRWAEAYLPGYGWVDFDPTLDRDKPPRADFVGTHHPRVLILSRVGSRSQQLGLSFVGANSHMEQTTRTRSFTWSQGAQARLVRALELVAAGKLIEARPALERIAAELPGTRAAQDARAELAKLKSEPPQPR